mmetsp:Transcript_76695/g.238114  ORF Transcript_76695/g.238114 Transcript_76695/m.238114 type:complete len:236 (+) Transcript_76695:168-875(+)
MPLRLRLGDARDHGTERYHTCQGFGALFRLVAVPSDFVGLGLCCIVAVAGARDLLAALQLLGGSGLCHHQAGGALAAATVVPDELWISVQPLRARDGVAVAVALGQRRQAQRSRPAIEGCAWSRSGGRYCAAPLGARGAGRCFGFPSNIRLRAGGVPRCSVACAFARSGGVVLRALGLRRSAPCVRYSVRAGDAGSVLLNAGLLECRGPSRSRPVSSRAAHGRRGQMYVGIGFGG